MVVDAGSLYTTLSNSLQLITPPNVSNPVEFWLAFLLLLAIINTALKQVPFFRDASKNGKVAAGLISLIISYFAVTVAWVSPTIVYFSSTLGITALIMVALLVVVALAGVDTKTNSKAKSALLWGSLLVGMVILVLGGGLFSYIFTPVSSNPNFTSITSNINWGALLPIILLVVIIGAVAAFAFSSGGSSSGGKSP
ncbi:hypothetical protein IHE51_00660 [Candidatus Parvarchaeota archaeon]|uniref:Uncharacterized protein n=1 Tax=Candidatus Acidifodinimicrobium mancum TaxID=2898728 RepID=A0A8T3V029_9ARCH|nr:hypothetical protein [Candidatus Acidifodinimicrobium mancum]MBE5728355.1 hypothetical protein [Candidatus Acidifodinimicrobium mancum]MBE5728821.1 hypothetical protein [Candidatus Acidifodinimicrobium mancum]MBE5730056.1 hypothetical protein [Candidatus Acidifodinimicrobium mancum]